MSEPAPRKLPQSRVDELGVRVLVSDLLEANATYASIAEAVLLQTGETISESALSRFAKHWRAQRASEEAMTQQLDHLADLLKANPEMDLKQGALGLFWKKLIQRMADADATFDGADMLDLGHLLMKATRLGQTKEHLDLQRERLDLVKQRAQQAAAEVETIGRAKNLDEATIREIQEKVYGIVPVAA